MRAITPSLGLSALLFALYSSGAQQAEIIVHAGQPGPRLSRYLTGACIEDVNHEIYGGLYSQMIFGESFQEPEVAPPLRNFKAYGGRWLARAGELRADGGEGPKLISDVPPFAIGEVQVEIFLPENRSGNAGLIVKTSRPGVGADKFTGYEIALDSRGKLIFGRHRQNWEPIQEAPCEVPIDQWIRLSVRMTSNTLEVLVNDRSILNYEDRDHPLTSGQFGLRIWQRQARFRNLSVKIGDQFRPIPFEHADTPERFAGVSGMWRNFTSGSAKAGFSLETGEPFFPGRQYQRMTFAEGRGEIGIENQGLNRWGMNFVAGKRYEGVIWIKTDKPTEFVPSLESADGQTSYCETRLKTKTRDWERHNFVLTPRANDRAGRFAIALRQPGSVRVGHVFLQPGEWGRFKGLPVRKDIADGLLAQGLTVLRYGGSMVNHPEYRWRNMIGPPDRRPPYHGTWYPSSSNGWGIFDFLNFCEAAGFLAVPAVNMDETAQDMADFVEYANGSARSGAGKLRAADAHAKPYQLKLLELGNEEAVDETYWQKFKPMAEAIWAKDLGVTLVVGDFAYDRAIEDPYNFSGAPRIKTLAAHQKILNLAKEHGREIWFDVHIGTERPPAPNGLPGVRSFIDQLGKLCPGAKYNVAIFEFNANNHSVKRALANALAVNQIERICPQLGIACSANCLQPWHQNDNGWNQGLLFFTPSQVWPQPPYYVTQMLARNYLPVLLNSEVHGPEGSLDVTATGSEDGKTLALQIANPLEKPVAAHITLDGFVPRKKSAHVTTLHGDLEAINTPDQPDHIRPAESTVPIPPNSHAVDYTFAGHSFTVLRME